MLSLVMFVASNLTRPSSISAVNVQSGAVYEVVEPSFVYVRQNKNDGVSRPLAT